MKRPRRNHSAAFKVQVALAALKGDKTLVELAEKYDVHGNQITQMEDAVAGGIDRGVHVAGRKARERTRSRGEGNVSQDRAARAGSRFFGSRARSRGDAS